MLGKTGKSLEPELMKRAEYHTMSQTVDVNTKPLKWPIAPDGYIPNSVIRSMMEKGKELAKMDRCDDIISYSLHQVDECTSNDEEDISTRTLWFIQEEEDEEEKTDDVKGRKKEKEDEKNENEKKKKTEVEEKERADEKKEREEDRMDGIVLVKQSYDIQSKTTLQNQLKTIDDGKMNVKPNPMREQREDMELCETITPPLQYLSVPSKQRTSSFISKERPEPPVEGPVVLADTVTPKQEPRITSYIPPVETKSLTSSPLKPPSPTLEDPLSQPNLGPPECSPIQDKRYLLFAAKYNNIRDQATPPLDRKVLELHKKIKVGIKNSNLHGGLYSPSAFRAPQPRNPQLRVQTNSGGMSLQGFCSPQAARLAATEHPVMSTNSRQCAATIPPLQPGPGAPQRVLQYVKMIDTPESPSLHFHKIIPMPSQNSFFTLKLWGETQYGRLLFVWKNVFPQPLEVSGVKVKYSAKL